MFDTRVPLGVERVDRPWAPRHPVLLFLLLLAAAGDFAGFYIALSLVADEWPVITLLIVLALTAAAVGLAHGIGTLLRARQDGSSDAGAAVLLVPGAAWLFLGVSAVGVRWAAAPAPVPDAGFASTTADTTAAHHMTSVLLLGLYLASGVLAAWVAYLDHDPARTVVRRAWRRLVWTRRIEVRRRAALARREGTASSHAADADGLTAERAEAERQLDALAEELKRYAGHLIAVAGGDPVSTEHLTRGARTGEPR